MSSDSGLYKFPLPDDWTVEDTICVTIRIPNDQQYFGTLIGLLDKLKYSHAFASDPTRSGAATVSRRAYKHGDCRTLRHQLTHGRNAPLQLHA